ncbi:ORF6N domain-containing protein [Niabella yanshanensis]|uniref:ORF6N domain-containing protein n=1 Tax=Niabella yanshanensis TaxID=577386 RepID=A0ABZ0WBQ7_9BACT|nr:ORF6N domain-containing protein [Niabella yanshanensis]WQD39974.1 ORF6N domain-containing protein [Niabella yanshanensis]
MKTEMLITDDLLLSKILQIRNQKVMIDRDLAEMYGVETRRLNEQVKRNTDRFPENFAFKLTEEEVELMVSQNAIPSRQILGGSLPNAFTEHGVLMLANVLKSKKAIEVSLQIIDIFVRLREALMTNQDILLKPEQLDRKLIGIGHDVKMHDGEIETIFELIKEIMEEKMRPRPCNLIGFKT